MDLQPDMLRLAAERAARRGVAARVTMQPCPPDSIGTVDPADFVLAFWMVHETPDVGHVLSEIRDVLKPGGRFLLVEPRGHVSKAAWDRTLELAGRAGLSPVARPRVFSSRAVLLAGG